MVKNENKEELVTLALTGMGMVTPLGYDVPTSCASIRAGISKLEELHEFPNEEFFKYDGDLVEVAGGRVVGLTDGHLGLSRFSRLALPAFKEASICSSLDFNELNRIKFIIALPDVERLGRDERMERLIVSRMLRAIGREEKTIDVEFIYAGHASACVALDMAKEILAEKEVDQIVIGGVESLIEPPSLIYLEKERRIKSESNVDGFNPGEASFFLVVETEESARTRNAEIIVYLKGIAVSTEQNSISSNLNSTGDGLSKALTKSVQYQNKDSPVNMVICDMNGERYRGVEWGYAAVRSLKAVKGSLNLWHHADCMGDTGTASAGISIIFGATAISRDYALGNHVLVWASSDDGTRGSLILEGTGIHKG